MKPMRLMVLVALLWAAPLAGLPANQAKDDQAEVALQAAVKAETVDGDLKGALEQYQRLANGGPRAVAAKALVRMGQCYEKLGDPRARGAYDRVARDFADQKETAAAARTRLAALDRALSGSSLVVRRVWTGTGVGTEGAPSWDGRYLSFTDQHTGNVALRDLATGETRDLTKNSSDREHPANRSVISPDGKTVAYTWITGDAEYDLRLIGTDGFGQRVLYRSARLCDLELGGWSPDGSRIVAALTLKDGVDGAETNQVALISVGDGSARTLKALGSRWPNPRGFSPDGRFIACDYPPGNDSKNRDVYLLAVDGDQEIPLVQHPADDRILGWVPDGKGILFASDRSGQWGVWFLQVVDGKPKGSPESIGPDLGDIEPLGFTRSGSFFYGRESGGMDVYLAALDPADSRLLTAPARINDRISGQSQYPLFSPDGQYLAYFSNRAGDRWFMDLRSLTSGVEREFPIPPDLERLRYPRWTANGQAVLVSGVDKQLRHVGFHLIDPRTGEAIPVMSSNPEAEALGGQWTPDGKSLFLARAGFAFADKASRILHRDLATGNERELFRVPPGEDITNLALSPDGLELAFSVSSPSGIRSFDRLGLVSIQGGDAHELLRLNGRETIQRDGLVWTPDGQRLLFAKAVETSRHTFRLELWQISPRDQEAQRIGVLAPEAASGGGSAGLGIHPDGKSIVFHARQRKPEVWLMENFHPAPRAPAYLDILHELTMEAWVNTSNLGPSQQTILAKGVYNYEGLAYSLTLNPQGKILGGVRHNHTSYGQGGDWSIDGIITDTALLPNTWYHVVCTIQSSSSVSIYVNGVLSKTGAITQSIPSRPLEPLRVGSSSYYGASLWQFNGLIDEVAIYDRALSADEILKHYQAGVQKHKS
jgi:Tol biopolymer transport system component